MKGYSGDLVKRSTTKESYPIVTNCKKIMAETLNEQKMHDKEAEKREKNIIIHGVPEDHKVAKDQLQDSDTSYVKGLFEEALQVNVQPSQKTGGGEKHPLLLEIELLADKTEVFTNLYKLWDAQIQYKNLNIMDDLTKDERDLIRAKVSEAKQKTRESDPENWIYNVLAQRKVQGKKRGVMAPLSGPSFRNVKKVIACISIFYTNADQLLNTMEDLKMMIANEPADIFIMNEIIHKTQRDPILAASMNIDGYDLSCNF